MKEAYSAEPSTLFVIGSYHIGKERAFFSAAEALGFRIWCDPGKKKVGSCSFFLERPNGCRLRPVCWGSFPSPQASLSVTTQAPAVCCSTSGSQRTPQAYTTPAVVPVK